MTSPSHAPARWIIAAVVCLLALPVSARAAKLTPTADAYVSSAHPRHNFGRVKHLVIERRPRVRTFLRFDLRSLAGKPLHATLHLYARRSSRAGVVVRAVGRYRWHEKRLTYRYRPRVGPARVRSGPLRRRHWKIIDVTPLVRGRRIVQLALTTAGRRTIIIPSREARRGRPRLVLTPRNAAPAAPPPAGLPPSPQTKVVMAVGDTCSSGGTPECTDVANVIRSQHPDAFFHLGDLQYDNGSQSAFDAGYGRIFADLHHITYPVFGSTHDFGWVGYPVSFMNQHSAAAGKLSDNQWGYSFDIGAWHVVALNYNHPDPGALEADLKAHPSRCLAAFDHAPYLGTPSSQHSSNELSKSFVQPLFNHGLDLFLNGHNHFYERLAPQTIDGKADPNGAAAFQVGTGGIGHYSFSGTAPNSVVRDATAFGALKLTLSPNGWTSQYINAPGSNLTDTASGGCGA